MQVPRGEDMCFGGGVISIAERQLRGSGIQTATDRSWPSATVRLCGCAPTFLRVAYSPTKVTDIEEV